MLRSTFTAMLLVIMAAAATPRIGFARPITPTVDVTVKPETVRPAQGGFIAINGPHPLEVTVELAGEPLPVHSTDQGYLAYFAFPFDAEPGIRTVSVSTRDPVTGAQQTFERAVTVTEYRYPLEQIALPLSLVPLLDPAINEREADFLDEVLSEVTTPARAQWPFDLPVPAGIVTSRFGGDRIYNGGLWQQYHTGADFRRSVGEPIYAVASGRVAAAAALEVYGGVLIIDHGFGVFTLYAHCSDFFVEVGDQVMPGQLVAAAGASGRTNGPHLHFEVIVNGQPVDPLAWWALAPGYVPVREVDPTKDTN
ncbi:MAG: M23 family metallopeptidase [Chloroflexi bacterium]|nr:M23 family metallopeptidase [Chloroflexota bacterium]